MKKLLLVIGFVLLLVGQVLATVTISTVVFYEKNKHLFGSTLAWTTDTIKVVFIADATSMDSAAHDYYDDVEAGAVSTPATLASLTAAPYAATGAGKLSGANMTSITVTGTWQYIVIYKDTAGASSTDPLILYGDAGSQQAAGTYNITWDANNGIIAID